MTDVEAGGAGAPLAGLRVVDLTRALAGPYCTLMLAGLGAEVIKIEDPAGGDVARGNAPYVGPDGLSLVPTGPDDFSLALLNRCRGKASVTLNLKHPDAGAVFADLVRHADIVVENFSAGTAERLGVGYSAAQQANPAVIYCSISGFGQDGGPGVRSMDAIVQALSGLMLASGGAEDPPIRVGVPVADVIAPLYAVIGILAALQRRANTGGGEHVDVSMLGALTSLVAIEDWDALAMLGQPLRTGPTLPRLSPFGLYRARDGWFALVAPQDKLVQSTFEVMGRRDLAADPRFATRDARVRHADELTAEIEGWSGGRDVAEVVDSLLAAGVPAAPVRTPMEGIRDERVTRREETTAVCHPTLGSIDGLRTAGLPITFVEASRPVLSPAPRLGEHTSDTLARLAGYSAETVRDLRDRGSSETRQARSRGVRFRHELEALCTVTGCQRPRAAAPRRRGLAASPMSSPRSREPSDARWSATGSTSASGRSWRSSKNGPTPRTPSSPAGSASRRKPCTPLSWRSSSAN
jgi:crotonobetainyl-CoA:carnitine CoA-transferase CaiB-like acyl-CoA transferase